MLTNFIYYRNNMSGRMFGMRSLRNCGSNFEGKIYSDMFHHWRKGGKPAFVSDEVWQSWQH